MVTQNITREDKNSSKALHGFLIPQHLYCHGQNKLSLEEN